jgi:redox-sensitive bicupin YhaK (pirin superfamily)
MEQRIIHRSETRGHAEYGWLESYHTFGFAGYHNPERVHFGALRVLNDDRVSPGMGFNTHPHDNMEIISIPLSGVLEHRDSMGNVSVIRKGDIQVLSAGSGITHSEFNKNTEQEVRFLQIWIFPNKRNVTPRYDQLALNPSDRINKFQQILSPNPEDEGVWIHQDAWFHIASIAEGSELTYNRKKNGNGIYFFIIEGSLNASGELLYRRDGMAVAGADSVHVTAHKDTEVLVMEVPMIW